MNRAKTLVQSSTSQCSQCSRMSGFGLDISSHIIIVPLPTLPLRFKAKKTFLNFRNTISYAHRYAL